MNTTTCPPRRPINPSIPAALQTPAQAPAPHPDERLAIALKASYQAGVDDTEPKAYVQGWRAGLFSGLWVGGVLGAVVVFTLVQAGSWWAT